ncbi:MAG: insulinase family protein [Verrucomicrobia bacterium]|nr:insulinase family protein [Verrucomicrobiota bacterium]
MTGVPAFPKTPPAPGPAGEYSFPPFTENRLDNGLRVLVCEDRRVPRVCASMLIATGLSTDEQAWPGLSAFLAELLKEGAGARSADEIAEAVDFMGATLDTGGNQDMIQVSVSMLEEYFADGLGLVADMVLEPTLPQDELEKLRRRELAELTAKHAQPDYVGRKICYRALYGEHPYGALDVTEESLAAMSREKLAAFRQAHFDPAKANLVVVGSISRNEVLRDAKSFFGGWKTAAPAAPGQSVAKIPPFDGRRVLLVDFPNAVQSTILIANHALPFGHADFVPFKVANQVLGGSFASRLFMNIREDKGYTYGAYSRPVAHVEAGSLAAWAAVRNEVTGAALKEFFYELERIRNEHVGDEELASAKAYLTGIFPIALERIEQIAAHIVSLKLYGLPDNHWDTYRDRITATTAEQVQQLAQRTIRPDQCIITVVGRAADLRPMLEPFGPVMVLDKTGRPA